MKMQEDWLEPNKGQPKLDDSTSVRPKVNDQFGPLSLSCYISATWMGNVPISEKVSDRRGLERRRAQTVTIVISGILPTIKEAIAYW
jgi:hypothetical protein